MQKKYLYGLVVAVIVLVVVSLIALTNKPVPSNPGLASYDNQIVPQSLISMLKVPANVSNAVNVSKSESNRVVAPLTRTGINATPLEVNGKPLMLYIGAEYCPYCAAERWAMTVALLRFGNFTNLKYMTSSQVDVDAGTPTFTFYNATYTSPYLTFIAVETTTNKPANSSYKGQTIDGYPVLQIPNSSENNLFSTYNPGGSIPFVDIANRSVQIGASYDPAIVLDGQNWTQVATELHNPGSIQAEAILSTANMFTAQICLADGNQPASVCSQPYVTALEK